jgi:predicted transcriptional regulator
LETLANKHGLSAMHRVVSWLADNLLAVPLPRDVQDRLTALAERTAGSRHQKIVAALEALTALPEFQLA